MGGTSYQLRHIGYNNASHGFIELVKHSSYITHYKNQYLYSIQGLLLEEHLYTICIRHLKPDYNGSVSKDQLNMAMEKLKKIVDFDRSSFDTHVTIYLQKGIFDFTETEVHVSGIQPDINIHNEIMTLFKFNILNRIKTIERMIVDMVSYIKILFAEDTQEDFTNRSSKTNPFMIHPKYFNL